MPFLPFRSKSVRSTSEEITFVSREAPGLVPRKSSVSSRTSKKVPEQTLQRANSNNNLTPTNQAMPLREKQTLPPPTNVGWGSLDPSVPKKISLTRRTLHPDARDPTASYHFRDSRFEDEPSTRRYSNDSTNCSQKHRSQLPANEQHQALLPRRMASVRRHSLTSRPSSTATEQQQKPKHRHSQSLPISKFNTSSGALARAADKAVSRTSMDADRHMRRPLNDISEGNASNHEPRSSTDSADDTVLIKLDSNSLQKTPVDGLRVNGLTRSERHAANKRLYHKMKAENHNLWVLLDASNRRADSMQQTLRTEENRCQSLEQRAQQLQLTLDTLNRRRLMLDNRADSVYTQGDVASKRQSNVGEVEAVTAELDYLRKNLARSRNSIRKLRGAASQPPPPMPPVPSRYDKELPVPEAEVEASIRNEMFSCYDHTPAGDISPSAMTEQRFSQVDKLDSHLHHLVKPKPVRPDKHCSTEAALLDHINTITETQGFECETVYEDPEQEGIAQVVTQQNPSGDEDAPFATPPSTPPPAQLPHGLDSYHQGQAQNQNQTQIQDQIHELPDTSITHPPRSRTSSTSSGYSSYGPTSSRSSSAGGPHTASTSTSPTSPSAESNSKSGPLSRSTSTSTSDSTSTSHGHVTLKTPKRKDTRPDSYAFLASQGPYSHSNSMYDCRPSPRSLQYTGSVPDLSSSSSSGSASGSGSGPPTPPLPPRSEKRLLGKAANKDTNANAGAIGHGTGTAIAGQAHIHPALRIDTTCAPKGRAPVGVMGVDVGCLGVGEGRDDEGLMGLGLGIKGLDLAV